MTGRPQGFDWSRLDAMTDEEIDAAARADPDAQPMTDDQLSAMKRIPPAKIIRRVLNISQEEFSRRFQIPLGTLRDWEQGRKEPDAAGRAYLTVIGRDPLAVAAALEAAPAQA